MTIHMLPWWVILLVLIGVAGFYLLKLMLYLIAGIVVVLRMIFGSHKINAHEYHLMYHPEDADK